MKHSFSLAIAAIINRPVQSILSALSISAGIALVCCLFLLAQGIENGLERNAKGIDIVVGAKGSPLQMVLSSVFQADIPTGNIDMSDAETLKRNPQVKKTIPLAMGDNYKGWRVIGTTPDYPRLYDAELHEGRMFTQKYEVTAGAATNLEIGEKFAAAHGFSADSDDVHDFHLYEVTGIFKPTGSVIDKLLLTSLESVQDLHSHHEEHEGEEKHHHHESAEDEAAEEALSHQVTAVLLQVRSPVSVMTLPRQINRSSNMQAASPAYEMTRLSRNLGLGQNFLYVIGFGIISLSMLMLFFSLSWGLSLRRYDLAVLRVLGAPRINIFATVLWEGIINGLAGAAGGILGGHAIAYIIVANVDSLQGFVLAKDMLSLSMESALILLFGAAAGAFAALYPALSSIRTDIAGLLSRGS